MLWHLWDRLTAWPPPPRTRRGRIAFLLGSVLFYAALPATLTWFSTRTLVWDGALVGAAMGLLTGLLGMVFPGRPRRDASAATFAKMTPGARRRESDPRDQWLGTL